MEKNKPGFIKAFNRKGFEMINLETVFREDKDLLHEFVFTHNRFVVQVISLISLAVNLFWFISYIITGSVARFSLGYIATLLMVVFPAFVLIYSINQSKEAFHSPTKCRAMQFLFHVFIIASVVMLEVARGRDFSQLYPGQIFNQVSLSCYWLIACAFIPLISNVDSAIVIALILLSAVIPQFLCPPGSYNITSNLIICLAISLAYLAFRSITLKSASLIKKLSETSYVDFQTKTLNRRALVEYFEGLPNKNVESLGVMVIDIDDLRKYNDSESYAKGDEAIVKVGDTIKKFTSGNDMVFRYGGGEFVVLTPNIEEENLVRAALKIKEAVENLKIERNDASARNILTVTIGCTLATEIKNSDRELLGETETQLAIGKRGAKDCVVFKGKIFIAEGEITLDQKPSPYTDRVFQAISEAMKRHEIKPYFQPLYETSTNKLVGAEALSRWVKDDGTVILPGEFVPELEKNSSILALDWYMFEECCKTLAKQKELGIPQVRISVNFSRMHALYERNIEARLKEIADSYGVPHSLIEIEITESAYIHLPNIIEAFIKGIRAQGFAVAVDDFGSGVSSLEFIKSVDVDTLKIDKSLISSNCTDPKERVLLESVVFLAHRLQLNSVAEGVETMEQLGFLKALGCNQIQGFIFAKPMPESDFLEKCRTEATTVPLEKLVKEHIQSPSMKILLDTVFKQYPIVVMGNLSKNSYYTMTYDSFTSHNYTRVGTITDLLDEIATTLCENDIEEFRNTFKIENQIAAYERGDDKISFTGRVHGDDESDINKYKEILTSTYFIKEEGNDDIQVITLCSESNLIPSAGDECPAYMRS